MTWEGDDWRKEVEQPAKQSAGSVFRSRRARRVAQCIAAGRLPEMEAIYGPQGDWTHGDLTAIKAALEAFAAE